ncbi:multicopper oxidase family protein [Clostridium fungisolvens]|uniref:Multicopper oxidase mco n=1 Tax=Clostridium fungisolvens TaxID=1604897 RepID=A0A6V8SBG3_9CLOT|nr:copper oxidase [Clostridium fungisolvens]GFP74574.1 Multicopper oxidase mco [Clostridium fungisolvens]
MVITPDINTLPCITKNGIKYFELIAEPVKQELLPDLFINAWGYNGSTPGPTILVYPGDIVNIRVYNNLPEPTSIHWHGLDVPNNMDGVPDVEPTPKIQPGSYFDYRFKIVNPPGTHMYHTHVNNSRQEMMGLCGGFIILDPKKQSNIDYDYFIMLQEFHLKGLEMGEIRPGLYDIDPIAHDFNFFTMNGRSFPSTTSITTSLNSIVRIRLGNISMNAHPIHLHGHQFLVVASDGNSMSYNNYLLKNTILVAPGETWDVIFKSDNPGIWPFHCHIAHHMSNNMTKPTGGMFTTINYKY